MLRGTMMDYPLTLISLLERAGRLFRQQEIVSRLADRTLHRTTYGEFHRRARALAEGLRRAGLRRGERVATLMWNHYAHLEACFGATAAGGVFHPLNFRLHAEEIAYTMRHARDRFLIVDEASLPLYEELKEKVEVERVWVARPGGPAARGYEDYEELLAQATGDFAYPALGEDEAASLCYTSGTTGAPKGTLYSHRALAFRCLALGLAEGPGMTTRDVTLPLVPFFHLTGWALPLVATMVGSKQVFPGPLLDAESVLDLMAGERVTFTAGVPTVWLGIEEALEKNPGRWSLPPAIRAIVGGAAPGESLLQKLDRHGIHLLHGWAMTETYPGVFNLPKSHMESWPEADRLRQRTSQGLPAPFVDIRAADESGREVPWDGRSLGELQIRSAGTAGSYFELPEGKDRWTPDGWFRTGDIASIDPEGYVRIADRAKDLVKSGGEWISSVDLENALMGHPQVKEAAVIAVPHPKWQERPLAVVVARGNPAPEPAELRGFLSRRFARWQLPDAFVFVDELPRTSTGKLSKTRLRERFARWEWD